MAGFQSGAFQSPGYQQAPLVPPSTLPRHSQAALGVPTLHATVSVPDQLAGSVTVPSRPTADVDV